MSKSVRALLHKQVVARDAPGGELTDVYVDDRDWRIRYFVIDPGRPMPRREVLVAPESVTLADAGSIRVTLTREELWKRPERSEDPPLYLQHGLSALPARGDPHLRSCEIILGYAVRRPGEFRGRVADLLIDEERRAIAVLVVDTGMFLPGRRIDLEPAQVERIDWVERRLHLSSGPRRARNGSSPEVAPG